MRVAFASMMIRFANWILPHDLDGITINSKDRKGVK